MLFGSAFSAYATALALDGGTLVIVPGRINRRAQQQRADRPGSRRDRARHRDDRRRADRDGRLLVRPAARREVAAMSMSAVVPARRRRSLITAPKRAAGAASSPRRERPRAWRVVDPGAGGDLLPGAAALQHQVQPDQQQRQLRPQQLHGRSSTARRCATRCSCRSRSPRSRRSSWSLLMLPTAVLVRLKLPKLTILMEAITILPIVVPPIVLAAGLVATCRASAPLWLVKLFFNHPLTVPDADLHGAGDAVRVPRRSTTALRAIDLHTLVDASRSLGAGWITHDVARDPAERPDRRARRHVPDDRDGASARS